MKTAIFTKIITFCVLLTVYLIPYKDAGATHVMGSDVEITCLGDSLGEGMYHMQLSLYRDCVGASLGGGRAIDITSDCGTAQVNLSRIGIADITPVCGDQCSACEADCPYPLGMELHQYEGIVDLSAFAGCCDFEFSFQLCCRNNAIENISSPGGSQYRFQASLNTCFDDCPSTPEYTVDPIAVFCQGEAFVFNQGVSIPGTDSLGFAFVDPLQQGGSPVSWTDGRSRLEPIPYQGESVLGRHGPFPPYGFHLDSITGDLMFTPSREYTGLISVGVIQYRDGDTVSITQRDLQAVVIDCPDNSPPFPDPPPDFEYEVCAGQNLSFPISVVDPDSTGDDPDSVYLNWNNGIDGAEFKPDSGRTYATGHFSWTPEQSDAGRTHQFVFMARDNACPVPGTYARAVRIRVNPMPQANINHTIQDCGEVEFTANLTNVGSANIQFTGTGGLNKNEQMGPGQLKFTHRFEEPGEHPVNITLLSNECANTYRDTIFLEDFIIVDAGPDIHLCMEGEVSIQTTIGYEEGNVSYSWSTGETTSSVTNTFDRDTTVIVTVEDESDCIAEDEVIINVAQEPHPELIPDIRICEGTAIEVGTGITSAFHHKWIDLATNAVIGTDTSLSISDSGTYVVEVTDTTQFYGGASCIGYDTIAVFVNPEVSAEANPAEICRGEESKLTATGGNEYIWRDMMNNELATGPEMTVKPTSTTQYQIVAYSITKGVYCQDIDTVTVTVNPLPNIIMPNPGSVCEDHGIFIPPPPNPAPNSAGDGWYGEGAGSNGLFYNIDAFDVGQVYLKYQYTDPQTGCYNTDSTILHVMPVPEVSIMNDTILCSNWDRIPLHADPSRGEWSGPGVSGDHFYPEIAGAGVHNVDYVYTDNFSGCDNRQTVRIQVYPSPEVDAGEHGPFCENEDGIRLIGSPGGQNGHWEGPGIMDNGRFNASEAGPGTHELTYIYTDYGLCTEQDATDITVNPLPEINAWLVGEPSVVCESADPITLQSSPEGGVWSGPGINHNNNTFNPAAAGPSDEGQPHQLIYQYEDNNGCTNEVIVEINVLPTPHVEIVSEMEVLCEGLPFILVAEMENANGLKWEVIGDGEIELLDAAGRRMKYEPGTQDRQSGSFHVTVTTIVDGGEGICDMSEDSRTIEIRPLPVTQFTVDNTEGCAPHKVQFTDISEVPRGGNVEHWEWNFGDGHTSTEQNPSHVFEEWGEYTVTLNAISEDGCPNDYNMEINVRQNPVVEFDALPILTTILVPRIEFENKTNEIGALTAYEWNFGDHLVADGGVSTAVDPVYTYSDTGKYTISLFAENEYGCTDELTKEQYIIIEPDVIIYVPNAFSPNQQGPVRNRTFWAHVDGYSAFNMEVYNRWGNLMFESNDPETGWDGTFEDEPAPEGVYFYVINLVGLDGKDYKYSGTVHLIR